MKEEASVEVDVSNDLSISQISVLLELLIHKIGDVTHELRNYKGEDCTVPDGHLDWFSKLVDVACTLHAQLDELTKEGR